MISAFMLVLTIGALVQFFFAYARTLLLTYGKVEISERTREVTGVDIERVQPEDFSRLMVLLRVAPDPRDDAAELRAVSIYFRAVQLANWLVSPLSRAVRHWSRIELSRCAHFAAVSLDRRLSPVAAVSS
jgi:hypothetical protein